MNKQVTKLRSLLINTRDFAMLRQGLALYAGVNSQEVTDGLASAMGSWEATGPAEPWIQQVDLGITAYAAAGTARAAVRAKQTSIEIAGHKMGYYNAGPPIPWDAAPLAEFTQLEHLSFKGCERIENLASLASLTNLKSLVVHMDSVAALLPDIGKLPNLERLDLKSDDTSLDFSALPRTLQQLKLERCKITHVDGIQSLTALVNLELQSTDVGRLDGVEKLTNLASLNLYYTDVKSLAPLASLSELQSLNVSATRKLNSLEGIGELTRLGALELNGSGIASLKHLPRMNTMTLNLRSCARLVSLKGIERVEGLEQLQLRDALVPDVRPLADCKALERIDLASSGVQSVDGLDALPKLRYLNLQNCRSLKNVDGLKGAKALEELSLHGCTALESVEGLAGCTAWRRMWSMNNVSEPFATLAKGAYERDFRTGYEQGRTRPNDGCLSLRSCAGLLSLKGLESLHGLKVLDLSHERANSYGYVSPTATDLSALAECTNLEWLDLAGGKFTSAAALASLDKLAWLSMSRCTAVKPSPSPKQMLVRKAVQIYLNRLGPKKPGAKRKSAGRLPKDAGKAYKLLSARDVVSIQQGVALAAQLPEVIDALLAGVKVTEAGEGQCNDLVPNKRFTGTGPAQPFLDVALRGLVARGTSPAAKALRDQLQVVHIGQVEAQLLTDCSTFTGLALRELRIEASQYLGDLSGLEDMTSLESLSLPNCLMMKTLKGVEGCESLAHVDLTGCTQLRSVEPLGGLNKLASIDLTGCDHLVSLRGLSSPALTDLTADKCSRLADLDGLTGGGLERISTVNCWKLLSSKGLSGHANLREANLTYCGLREVDGLAGKEALAHVSLKQCKHLMNLDGLADLTGIERLELYDCVATDVRGLTRLLEATLEGGFVVTSRNATNYPTLAKVLEGRKTLTIT